MADGPKLRHKRIKQTAAWMGCRDEEEVRCEVKRESASLNLRRPRPARRDEESERSQRAKRLVKRSESRRTRWKNPAAKSILETSVEMWLMSFPFPSPSALAFPVSLTERR